MLINEVNDVLSKLDIMSYLNIMSFSVLSGIGSSISPSLHDLDTIEELCRYMPPNQRPYNISFTNGLYKCGMPIYAAEIENPYNFEGYFWIDKKQKKSIDIDVQALSIINCCRIIEKLITCRIEVENPQFIAFLLFKAADYQARFIKKHLRIGDIYYSGEEAVEKTSKESRVQVAADEPDAVSQLSVMLAFTSLNHISSFNIPYMTINPNEFEDDLRLLPYLYHDILEHISEIKSRELINIGLYIASIYINNASPCKNAYAVLYNIGQEIMKRINESGMITRTALDLEESSFRTLSNGLNLFSQLYYMFGDSSAYQFCIKLYEKIDSAWDQEHRIFKIREKNKQIYSIKDISAVMSALLSFYSIAAEPKLSNRAASQIIGFYETAFVNSSIFRGQTRPILQQSLMNLKCSGDAGKDDAPVFSKSFEYKLSKNKYYCEADIFRADHVLYACCLLLGNISSYCM